MSAPDDRSDPASPPPEAPPRRRFLVWLSRAFLGLWGLGAAAVVGAGTMLRSIQNGKAQQYALYVALGLAVTITWILVG